MLHSNNRHIAKIVEVLEGGNLFSEEEITWVEDYLNGDVGDEVLGKFAFRDLSGVSNYILIYNEFVDLIRQETDAAGRLAKLLFTVGEASSYRLFPSMIYRNEGYRQLQLEPAQIVTLYAAYLGVNEPWLSEFKNLMDLAGHDPMNLKKALGYRTGPSLNGRLILLATYFVSKYPNSKSKAGVDCEAEIKLEADDAPLMESYENLIINAIPMLFQGRFSQQDMEDIQSAVKDNSMDERILKLADSCKSIDGSLLALLGGTAFVNHRLSVRLKNVVSVCLAADGQSMLNDISNMDVRGDMRRLGGSFDTVFGMDSVKLIRWLASDNRTDALKEQFCRNQEAFLKVMDASDFDIYNRMASILQKEQPELFKKRVSGEKIRQQTKLINSFVKNTSAQSAQLASTADDIRKYLSGEGGIELVYSCADVMKDCYYWGNRVKSVLEGYQKLYGYDTLSNRCETLLLAGNGCPVYYFFIKNKEVDEAAVKRVFAVADSEGLNLVSQLNSYAFLIDCLYNGEWTTALERTAKEIFGSYLEKRPEETLAAFREAGSIARVFALRLMGEDLEKYKDTILGFAGETAKSVREELLNILYGKKEWEADVKALLEAKKAAERETAIRVLAKWREEAETAGDTSCAEGYKALLAQALEKEKNAKMRALLEGMLNVSVEADGGGVLTQEELVKEIHKGNKKRSLAWAYETPFSKVHKKDGEEANEEYLQAIVLWYSSMSPCGVNQSAAALAESLDEREFAIYANELFDKWMEAGAESKKRWVLYAAAIHGGDDIVNKLHHQIQEWPQASRGAIASEAVQALALSPKPQGLLVVDGISRKFKFKQVKAAAVKALEFAASQLGITTEELADRIVPNLGFDENMQRIFDYGERKFTVTITTALEIEVFDASGKKLKNLPAPGKKDDEAKAAGAYEDFKQMKKQMKTTVSGQKMRLEMALSTERRWSVRAWKDLFVKNPIMHQFAIGLIWGIYEGSELVASFRYMEDGSFNTEDEEEFILPEEEQDGQSAKQIIGIIHPIELSEESLKTWKEQLEDYEIVQPIEQLDRQVYYRTPEEENMKVLERFGGMIVNDLSLGGKLQSQGWYKGEVIDGGCCCSFYREDKELGLGAVLYFSGSYVGGSNEDVTVYGVRFFVAGQLVTWSYEEKIDLKSSLLSEVPERYFSEIVLQVAKATAASKERDENWKKHS